MKTRSFLLSFGFFILSAMAPFLGQAQTKRQMGVILNLSGKQRMLTQKMTKEALLIAKKIDTAQNKRRLKQTAALFERTLKGLLNGDRRLRLVKTKSADIRRQLLKVQALWTGFRTPIQQAAKGNISKAVLEKLAVGNLPLLKEMDRAVKMYEVFAKKNPGTKMKAGMAVVLNLSGRQRMLTQKVAKEILLISLGIDVKNNREKLEMTMSLFTRTLGGLLYGDVGQKLPGTKNVRIRNQINKIFGIWGAYRKIIENVLRGKITRKELRTIAHKNLPLLREMDRAVKMYERSVR